PAAACRSRRGTAPRARDARRAATCLPRAARRSPRRRPTSRPRGAAPPRRRARRASALRGRRAPRTDPRARGPRPPAGRGRRRDPTSSRRSAPGRRPARPGSRSRPARSRARTIPSCARLLDPGVRRRDQDAQPDARTVVAPELPERKRLLLAGELRRDLRGHVAGVTPPLRIPDRDGVRIVLVLRVAHDSEPAARRERVVLQRVVTVRRAGEL